jgi:DnaJ-class molecular chaperone
MLTSQERLNYAIAVAARTGKTISDPSVSALGSKVVICPECDGTGMPENAAFRRDTFCKACSGRGFVSVAQPKTVKGGFDVVKTPQPKTGTR